MKVNSNLLLAVMLYLAIVPAALARTWFVNGSGGNDANDCATSASACATIGHAIALTTSGDAIQIAAGTYPENITIPFDLSLNGAQASSTIIDGGNSADVIVVDSSSATVALANLTIQRGFGNTGGGVFNAGTMTITNCVITGNQGSQGGGIYNSGTLTISTSTISGNTAGGTTNVLGGGIYNSGTLILNNSTVSNNSGNQPFVYGGAIENRGRLTINNSTLNANSANGITGGAGGAIDTIAGTVAINNSTMVGNTATAVFGGGALYVEGGSVKISNSTFKKNSSLVPGGAISNVGGSVVIQNSIVAGSKSGGNCYGTITSDGYNLSSDGTCNFSNNGDLNSVGPRLGPLQNNGGSTLTMALMTGSPAIDAGNPTGCTDNLGQLLTSDQRGQPRPDKGETRCDMGAYENQSYATTTALSSSSNPSSATQSVTFTATVSSTSGAPTGAVTFTQNGTPVATVALSGGKASFSRTFNSSGTKKMGAVYSGDGSFDTSSGSMAQVVK